MKIDVVYPPSYPHPSAIAKAIELVNFAQSTFFAKATECERDLLPKAEGRGRGVMVDFANASAAVRKAFPNSRVVYITDDLFDNNWFSDNHSDVCVVSTNGWSENFSPPSVAAYISREIVLSILCFASQISDDDIDKVSVDPSMGCVFDFCRNKADVRFGLAAGYIHPVTQATLRQFGIRDDSLKAAEKILNLIRLEAIGRPARIEPSEAFVVMKFSQNDENFNAYQYGLRPALEEFGLAPKRADEDPRMSIISTKVTEHIEKSRLIVIMLDERNVNVFFELGYAVAKDKEILLVSRRDQVALMPTDIKGWELLTYTLGDYRELKSNALGYLENMLPYRRTQVLDRA